MLGNPVWRRIVVWSVGVTAVGGVARGADVTVDSLADELHLSGCAATGQSPCSLRDALTWANANPGRDTITIRTLPTYDAPEAYRLKSPLPAVTDAVDLLGQRDPRWHPSDWPVIDGKDAGVADGLTLTASDCLVRSIWIQGFRGRGLVVKGDRNVIGGENSVFGASSVIAQGVHIEGNAGAGIEIQSGTGNAVLGSVVGPNRGAGVLLGTGAWGNRIGALEAPSTAGDSGTSNTIAGNGGAGIRVGTSSGDVSARANVIGINSIRSNVGPGIDLAGDCLPADDPGDADSGPNDLINAPVISSATLHGDGSVTLSGSYSGLPSSPLTLRFYANPDLPAGAPPQGERFLGTTAVTTDASGAAVVSATLSPTAGVSFPATLGTVTATAQDGDGNTSEFSSPASAPAAVDQAFHTLSPCRALDTRTGSGAPLGGPALDGPRSLALAGVCGVPTTARAVTLNATVVGATGAGHVTLSPLACAPDASTLNFAAGQTRANNAVATLDAAGRLVVHSVVTDFGSVDLVLDVTGYYE